MRKVLGVPLLYFPSCLSFAHTMRCFRERISQKNWLTPQREYALFAISNNERQDAWKWTTGRLGASRWAEDETVMDEDPSSEQNISIKLLRNRAGVPLKPTTIRLLLSAASFANAPISTIKHASLSRNNTVCLSSLSRREVISAGKWTDL